MPKLRPIVTQADAALALAEDFARAARDMNDMSNYYRWRDVAKQWRIIASTPSAPQIDWASMPRPSFSLSP